MHCQGTSGLVKISTPCLHRWKRWQSSSRSRPGRWCNRADNVPFHQLHCCYFLFNKCM